MLATWQVGQMFWSFLWFSLFFLWIWMVISVFSDVFTSADLGGWAKAAWTVVLFALPFLGVLVYLIARGRSMQERAVQRAQAQDDATRLYIREVARTGGGDATEQIAKAAELLESGAITDDEFQVLKAKALA